MKTKLLDFMFYDFLWKKTRDILITHNGTRIQECDMYTNQGSPEHDSGVS